MDIQASLETILANGTEFSESFYHQLSEDFPDVFAHFDGSNLKHQTHMLNNSLLLCVQGWRVQSESIKYYLQILGTKHSQRGIAREAYAHWTKTMLTALETYHGEQWNAVLAEEWQAAFEKATEQMFIGYDEPCHM